MGKTIRNYKGTEFGDKDGFPKKKQDRKRFVYEGEGHTTKAQGGPGNKRAWNNSRAQHKWMAPEQYQRLIEKNQLIQDEIDLESYQ